MMAEQMHKHLKSSFDSLKVLLKSACVLNWNHYAPVQYETFPPLELGQQKPDGSIWSLFELIILNLFHVFTAEVTVQK